MSEQPKTVAKISGTPEELREALKGNKVEIGLDIDGRDPKQREFLKDILNKDEQKAQQPDLSDKKIQVYKRFGDSRALDCQTTEELRNFVTQKVNDASKPIPAGSPLVPQQYGQKDDLYTHHYSDFGSMVNDLKNRIRDPNSTDELRKEAQSYYDSLLKKWIQTQKRNPEVPTGFYDPNVPEHLPSDLKRTPEGFLISENESDLQRLQARWRAERLRKMGKGINDKGEVVQ